MVDVDGVNFEDCYSEKTEIEIEGITVKFINTRDLIKSKKTMGRLQDLADAKNLQKIIDEANKKGSK